MCAIEAGKRGRSVSVLERNTVPGEKIRISGGGRCNFTNMHTQPENFISDNPSFHKSALSRYQPDNFLRLVERHRIAWHEKKLGQLFCDRSSQEILGMLKKECAAVGAKILTGCRVEAIGRVAASQARAKRERDSAKQKEIGHSHQETRAAASASPIGRSHQEDGFTLSTNLGVFECASLVVATGGLSIPKMGATDFGYRVAKQFGLRVTALRPGLVPLLFEEPKELHVLHGVAFEAEVRCGRTRFRENVLFTHRGLSGPAILQISSYWKPGDALVIEAVGHRPRRFAQAWKEDEWSVTPTGTEGYAKAEVTAGGVDTNELSSKTMEARKVPGLYFVGEVVDVTGQLGGFNFQWAWASGFAAGQSV